MNPSLQNKVNTNIMDHMAFGKHSTDLFGDISTEFIQNYDDDKPFFLCICHLWHHMILEVCQVNFSKCMM